MKKFGIILASIFSCVANAFGQATQEKSSDVHINVEMKYCFSIIPVNDYLQVKAVPDISYYDLYYTPKGSAESILYDKDNKTFNQFLKENSKNIEKVYLTAKQN